MKQKALWTLQLVKFLSLQSYFFFQALRSYAYPANI